MPAPPWDNISPLSPVSIILLLFMERRTLLSRNHERVTNPPKSEPLLQWTLSVGRWKKPSLVARMDPPHVTWIDSSSPNYASPQLHPSLRRIQFTNSAGHQISLDEKRHHVAWYDIQNNVNFPAGLSLLVKVGEFVSRSPQEQGLVIDEEMVEWPIGFPEVWLISLLLTYTRRQM